jgi:proline dehydrogenase
MSVLANTTQPILNPDNNPVLRLFLKKTFYAQFCAGENAAEVQQTINSLKQMGFGGVILGYAREVVLTEAQMKDLSSCASGAVAEECIRNEITPWAEGTLQTVRLAEPGDFVALKFTGAGRQALLALSRREPPTPALASAIDEICQLAASRGVRLLLDAEQQALQPGIDDWSLDLMRRYNPADRPVVYGTYQAYLKSTPATLARHLAAAKEGGFALGVKLVRGAYLGSDPRHLIHDTKEDTDRAYDGVAEALLRRRWNEVLRPMEGESDGGFANVGVVLATHNRTSVLRAQDIIAELGSGGSSNVPDVAFAQLQGMADEVSCELMARASSSSSSSSSSTAGGNGQAAASPRVYKYLVWGSTGECMKYLLRRAHENRDAVQRTRDGREAMKTELVRRLKGALGLSG